jgi:tetratricopeptide (TPR) repeat protein
MALPGLAYCPASLAAPQEPAAAFKDVSQSAHHDPPGGQYAQTLDGLERAYESGPSDPEAAYNLALAYFRLARHDDARRVTESFLAKQDAAGLYNLLGAIEEAAGRIDEAARSLQRGAELEPTEQHVFDFGSFLLRHYAGGAALRILEYGASKHPRSARMQVALGIALHANSKYDEAVEAMCLAVDLDPDDPRPLTFLGEMYDISPRMAKEVTVRFKRFVESRPANPLANYYYALSLWSGAGEEGPLDEVEALLKKAVSLDPALFEAHYQLGRLYERLERLPEAAAAYERAVEIQPDFERAFYRLGTLYVRQGRPEEGREMLARHRVLREQAEDRKTPRLTVE